MWRTFRNLSSAVIVKKRALHRSCGHYFMMVTTAITAATAAGFVPMMIVGKAFFIWMNFGD
jgi:hypothetical protein